KVPQLLKDFTQVNLVGNNDEYNPARVDPLLVNGWGLAFSPTGIAWISAEGTGVSTVYNSEGSQVLPAVSIPSPGGATGGHPTGVVFNGTTDFKLPNGNPARFIFDGVDGVISGWNGGPAAIKVVDNSSTSAYTGLAIANDGGNNFLYAANFRAGKIDVFDKDWVEVNTKPFMDPNIPAGYAPFNIQTVGQQLYVTYAKVDPAEGEEEKGPGLGYVDIYNTDGSFVKRFVSNGQLNAPWGIAWAPAGFFGTDERAQPAILIGNFGDGHINAYSQDGNFLGQLRAHGNPIVIEGLWAISFPPATATSINSNRLYFAAGPDDEEDGLFGYIVK
ncbi:MAG TPA: TIGR03118 family protein, partial [Hanamia sp.]|nr:TIGR03118 family protein [Hanamia sp.]